MGRSKKIFLSAILSLLLFLPLGIRPLMGADNRVDGESKPKVIMVVLDRVSYPELKQWNLPNLHRLMELGGLGLMTITCEGELNDRNVYATIGAGSSTSVKQEALENYNSLEFVDYSTAADLYRRNSGYKASSDEVVQTSLKTLLENSKRVNQPVVLGALGETLHEKGLKTAVIGNSDLPMEGQSSGINRLGPLVAMDSKGRVDFGDVSRDLLKRDNMAPFGVRTNYDFLWKKFKDFYAKSDFMVIDTGDSLRVDAYSVNLIPGMLEMYRKNALQDADSFIGRILGLLGRNDLLMLVTPLPPEESMNNGEKLSPVIIYGPGIAANSVLASPTTRQAGLISTYDIAPTVLKHLGADNPSGMIGFPVTGQRRSSGEPDRFYTRAVNVYNQRTMFLNIFIALEVLALILIVIPLIRRSMVPRWYTAVLYSLGTAGVALLLVPLFGNLPLWGSLLVWLAIMAFLTIAVLLAKGLLIRMALLGGLVSAIIIIEVVCGGPLMRWSYLGYDLIVGGRFYGIGNEFMGILIGAFIMLTTGLTEIYRRGRQGLLIGIALAYVALIYFFASPRLGTNAGGALAAIVGFSVTMYRLAGWHLNWRKLGIVALAAVILGVVILIGVNKFMVGGQESHISRAVSKLLSGNFGVILQIIIRKAAANIYLILYSSWNKLVLAIVVVTGLVYFLGREKLARAMENYPGLGHGLVGTYAGAVAALVFNDSGVISLATMGVFPIVTLYSLFFLDYDQAVQGGRKWFTTTGTG